MDSDSAPHRAARLDRACLVAAFALPIGWFFIYDHFRPDYLVDESGHLGAIYHFFEGKPGWPEQMTMLPGYHFIVVALWELHPPLKLLTLARLVSLLFALGGLAAFTFARRRLHRTAAHPEPAEGSGRATLLLALLPILQPFTGMAYTDVPALACILAAFAAQLSHHRILAAVGFAIAALVRQTNLLWAAFVLVFEWWRPGTLRRDFFRRIAVILVVLGLAALAIVWAGRFTVGSQTGTDLRPNVATLHFAALLVLFLGLPVWLAHLPDALRRGLRAARADPWRTLIVAGAALAAVTILVRTFANPHPWNRELTWPGNPFTLLRNWPLVGFDRFPVLRVASAVNIVLMAVALLLTLAAQVRRRELAFALLFGALLPFANNLVEPRYFIPGAAFFLLFLDLTRADMRRLLIWWGLLCAGHAPFVARGLSLW
jgi:hypothetical protein